MNWKHLVMLAILWIMGIWIIFSIFFTFEYYPRCTYYLTEDSLRRDYIEDMLLNHTVQKSGTENKEITFEEWKKLHKDEYYVGARRVVPASIKIIKPNVRYFPWGLIKQISPALIIGGLLIYTLRTREKDKISKKAL